LVNQGADLGNLLQIGRKFAIYTGVEQVIAKKFEKMLLTDDEYAPYATNHTAKTFW
jgi:hypothetical protein